MHVGQGMGGAWGACGEGVHRGCIPTKFFSIPKKNLKVHDMCTLLIYPLLSGGFS